MGRISVYADIDRPFLKKAGLAILDDSEAFLEIDDSSSIISSCGPDIPVREIVSDISRPMVKIWDRLKDKGAEQPFRWIMFIPTDFFKTDTASPRVGDMIRNHYKEFEFPHNKEHFGDIAIYMRQKPAQREDVQYSQSFL